MTQKGCFLLFVRIGVGTYRPDTQRDYDAVVRLRIATLARLEPTDLILKGIMTHRMQPHKDAPFYAEPTDLILKGIMTTRAALPLSQYERAGNLQT